MIDGRYYPYLFYPIYIKNILCNYSNFLNNIIARKEGFKKAIANII